MGVHRFHEYSNELGMACGCCYRVGCLSITDPWDSDIIRSVGRAKRGGRAMAVACACAIAGALMLRSGGLHFHQDKYEVTEDAHSILCHTPVCGMLKCTERYVVRVSGSHFWAALGCPTLTKGGQRQWPTSERYSSEIPRKHTHCVHNQCSQFLFRSGCLLPMQGVGEPGQSSPCSPPMHSDCVPAWRTRLHRTRRQVVAAQLRRAFGWHRGSALAALCHTIGMGRGGGTRCHHRCEGEPGDRRTWTFRDLGAPPPRIWSVAWATRDQDG